MLKDIGEGSTLPAFMSTLSRSLKRPHSNVVKTLILTDQ
uniref:Uncharacterized protein n=1 Tax=Myoviridae sp. ct3wi9 TaxID=2826610 RepID=A0A8S5MWG5_9CAUD|nr:MAG TPA: hypothetical protein [Myoviridae sp. ct3wi9]DAF01206.1 MAG TPA: hypothetical protein [Caudoviricetes sp.]DAR61564.1 MAG TPA: hypothetical protein [Bacteriophage sp.]DAI05015.1 MAG TPA: hypothetical protein [Caudoviricetes sp.]DAM51472.1 MAG TPA: hypothetical protein [Caudoviricetes sp.]